MLRDNLKVYISHNYVATSHDWYCYKEVNNFQDLDAWLHFMNVLIAII